ncbi:MAG: hypothetical protein KAG14_04410 [Mycoplasmataceae bacterium]|nr:hypothetical protein [Mycoplasmataceae bacterium]
MTKICITKNIFKWINYFSIQKNSLVITPITKVSSILSFKKDGHIFEYLRESIELEKLINEENINNEIEKINNILNYPLFELNLSNSSIYKMFFNIVEENINETNLLSILKIIDKFITKKLTIYIVEIPFDFEKYYFENINISMIVSNTEIIKWETLENIVFLDEDMLEILDRDKFISWLEFKTNMVINEKILDDYFKGVVNMNTLIITKAIKNI